MVYLRTGRPIKLILFLIPYLLLLIYLLIPHPAHAAVQWSLSVVEGYYFPKLKEINYLLNNKTVELGPFNTAAKPSPYPVIYQGLNPGMPDMRP